RADTLLARGHEKERGKPFRQRELGTLKHRPDRDRELLAALVALVEASAMLLALKLRHLIGGGAAVRADRTIRPDPCLKPLAGLAFAVESGVAEGGGLGLRR